MFIRLNRKGQSTLEYGVVIAVIVAALIAMQVYIKRGVQGRLRQSTDDIGDQFSPGFTETDYTTTSSATSTETVNPVVVGDVGMSQAQTQITDQQQHRVGSETVAAATDEFWPQ